MNQVSDPTLVFARHQRVKTHGCVCGWSAHDVTHADHIIQELGNSGFAIVDVRSLVNSLGALGFDVAALPVLPYVEPPKPRVGGVTEVAQVCGVSKSRASMWMTRADHYNFPSPYQTLASGNVYDLDVVVEWYKIYKSTRNGNGVRA